MSKNVGVGTEKLFLKIISFSRDPGGLMIIKYRDGDTSLATTQPIPDYHRVRGILRFRSKNVNFLAFKPL